MTTFYFTESQVSSSIPLNTCIYNVCGIKLEMKVICLHKIRVDKISLFHLKSVLSITFDYYL